MSARKVTPEETKTQNCPDSETMLYYIEGLLSNAKVKQIKKHLAICIICRGVAEDGIEIKKEAESKAGVYGKTPLYFLPLHLPPIILN